MSSSNLQEGSIDESYTNMGTKTELLLRLQRRRRRRRRRCCSKPPLLGLVVVLAALMLISVFFSIVPTVRGAWITCAPTIINSKAKKCNYCTTSWPFTTTTLKTKKRDSSTESTNVSPEDKRQQQTNISTTDKATSIIDQDTIIDAQSPSLLVQPSNNWTDEDSYYMSQLQDALDTIASVTVSEPSSFGGGDETVYNTSAPTTSKTKKKGFTPKSLLSSNPFFSISKKPAMVHKDDETVFQQEQEQQQQEEEVANLNNYNNNSGINTTSSSFLTSTNTTTSTPDANNNNSNTHQHHHPYDPSAALTFLLDSQANFTKQQLEAAQKMLYAYSTNATKQLDYATKQLDSAQRSLLEGFMAQVNAATAAAANHSYTTTTSSSTSTSPITTSNNRKPITMDELEAYLRLNGYVKQVDLNDDEVIGKGSRRTPSLQVGRGRNKVSMTTKTSRFPFGVGSHWHSQQQPPAMLDVVSEETTSGTSTKSSSSRVAFPQPSVLSYKKLKWGSTVAAAFLGLMGGITVLPNLWLLGAILGGLYGYETTKNLSQNPPTNALANLVVYLGRELTKTYLKVYDIANGLWFM